MTENRGDPVNLKCETCRSPGKLHGVYWCDLCDRCVCAKHCDWMGTGIARVLTCDVCQRKATDARRLASK